MLFDHLKWREFITLIGGSRMADRGARTAVGDAGHGGPSVVVGPRPIAAACPKKTAIHAASRDSLVLAWVMVRLLGLG